jgi:hypothetical protein
LLLDPHGATFNKRQPVVAGHAVTRAIVMALTVVDIKKKGDKSGYHAMAVVNILVKGDLKLEGESSRIVEILEGGVEKYVTTLNKDTTDTSVGDNYRAYLFNGEVSVD